MKASKHLPLKLFSYYSQSLPPGRGHFVYALKMQIASGGGRGGGEHCGESGAQKQSRDLAKDGA